MDLLVNYWEAWLVAFMLVEKIVKLSPAKWDDIIIDGIKEILAAIVKIQTKDDPPEDDADQPDTDTKPVE